MSKTGTRCLVFALTSATVQWLEASSRSHCHSRRGAFTRAQIQEARDHGDQLQVYPALCEVGTSDSEKLDKIVLNT